MYLSNKNKHRIYYVYHKNEITGKYTRTSTRTKIKSQALNFLSELQKRIENKKTERERTIHYWNDLKPVILKYVSDNMQAGTLSIYKNVMNNFERISGNKPLKLINGAEIENYKNTRANEVSKATTNIDIRTLRAIFNIAIRFEWVSDNPLKYVKKLTIPEKEYLAFTRDETEIILNNIENACLNKLCYFALLTGCRIDEIINLQWRDVNLNESAVIIRNKPNFKTKTGRIREIPVSDELNTLLKSMLETEGNVIKHYTPDMYIFANGNGYKYTKDYVSKYFKRVLRKLNFPEKYHFHCLRHTYITALIKGGVNINYVKEIAGHSSIKTTENYIHISNNDLREAIKKVKIL
jgi:integrase